MNKYTCLVTAAFLALTCSYHTHAQIITTVAGCDDTTLGDGGLATNAYLNGPYDVALDGKGNFYVTDGYHNRIRKVDAAGIITTIAGTGVQGYNGDGIAATSAQIYRPVGIIFDHSGNLYFCDSYNNRIREIDTNGIIYTVAGNGNSVYNGDSIRADSAAIYDPHCVAIDARGNLYITDFENHRIRKVDTAGIITTIAGTGTAGNTGDNGPATMAEVNGPYGIGLDDTGNVYFADIYEHRVRKISTSGIITTFAGGGSDTSAAYTGPADSVALWEPAGICTDHTNNVYITDAFRQHIYKVTAISGVISTVAGSGAQGFSGDNGPAINAELNQPAGITVDPTGALYIADFSNGRIRRVGFPETVEPQVLKVQKIDIYPNPSPGSFYCNVTSTVNECVRITITNALGEQVKEIMISANHTTLIQLNQPAGTYFFSTTTSNGTLTNTIEITPSK